MKFIATVVILSGALVACDDGPAEGEGEGEGETEAITPRFELAGEGFYRTPWPADHRTDGEGHLDLDGYPLADSGPLSSYKAVIEDEVRGFATTAVITMTLDRDPGADALPTPLASLSTTSPLQLLDVSAGGCGERVPIEARFHATADEARPANTLIVAPPLGFVLAPATPYALVVLRTFGAETARPEEFQGVLEGTHPDAFVVDTYAPLAACAGSAGLALDDIAVATVFTTQDPVGELRRARAFVVDPAQMPAPSVRDFVVDDAASVAGVRTTFTGAYDTPIFQRGTTPYNTVGNGGIRFDGDRPILVRMEEVRFSLVLPDAPPPPSGFPVLLFENGTGHTLTSHVAEAPITDAVAAGFAVASFVAQFHDGRSGPNADPVVHSFNLNNPESVRSVYRQQAIDTSYFIRVLREGVSAVEAPLDTAALVYMGQSQGAIVGGIVAGVETEIVAYVFNGAGANHTQSISERNAGLLQALLGVAEPPDRFHPAMTLMQTVLEAADPANYAASWRGHVDDGNGASVFLVNGALDEFVPADTEAALIIAGRMTPIDPLGFDIDPFGVANLAPVELPISGNSTAIDGTPLTIATLLRADSGHFTIFDDASARATAIGFLESALAGSAPLLE